MSFLSRIRKTVFSDNFNKEFELIRHSYRLSFRGQRASALVISCLDSRFDSTGFADRLRGMISCFAYAKAIGVPFRIEHISPFSLSTYLIPNQYDWLLGENEKSFNLLCANPVVIMQRKVGQRSRRLFHLSSKRQHHIYINSDYVKEINLHFKKEYLFSGLYSELFRPSLSLETILQPHRDKLRSAEGYISVSFRFMQLMGDFKDVRGETLSREEQLDLLGRSIEVIQQLYCKEHKMVLVTSDSSFFINEVSKISYVYVVPGRIGHIGFSVGNEVAEKMFLDFLLISEADHVYMARSGKMYRSNFARTAALTRNVLYDEITY